MSVVGRPVRSLLAAYGLGVRDLLVVHDDMDLPEDAVRAKRGGGHGGHNGLRSLIEAIRDPDFDRVRVGVGRPPGRMDPADYVLEPLRGAAAEPLASSMPTAVQCVVHVIEHGVEDAMREYNG